MLSEREHLILDIVNDVADLLTEDQLDKLKLSLYKRISPLEIRTAQNDIVVYDQPNDQIINMWLMAKKLKGLSPRSIAFYRSTLYKVDRDIGKPLLSLSSLEIQCYLAAVAEKTSATNANNILRCLSSMFTWLSDTEYIAKNPLKRVEKIKARKKQRTPFTQEEIERLRAGAADSRTRSMVEMLLSTGCRVSELVGIQKEAIDWDRGEVIVVGKGNKERIVFINEAAKLHTLKYLEGRTDNNPSLYVSLDKPYDSLKTSGVEIVIRNLGKSTGVKNCFPHRFRHTAATFACRRGMGIEIVKKMLGHESVDTTMIYAQTDWEAVRAARKIYCE